MRQDSFGLVHELLLGRFCATFLVMFSHQGFHLGLLFGGEVEVGHCNRTRHLAIISSMFGAIAMVTREHGPGCKHSRGY